MGLAFALGASAIHLFPDAPLLIGPLTLAVTGLSYFGIEHLMARAQEEPVHPLVVEPRRLGPCVLIALTSILLAQAGAAGIAWIQTSLVGIEATEQDAILELVEQGGAQLVLLGISAVVLAPLTEELLFRHMFFRRLLHRSGPVISFGLSALAFSLFHFNPSGVVIYVWLGLVFASAYLLSGRLWVAMLTHAGYNAAAFAVLVWVPV